MNDTEIKDIFHRMRIRALRGAEVRLDHIAEAQADVAALVARREAESYKRGVRSATGSYAYSMPMKSMRSRNTAFKLYAVKFFNGEIRKRRERLLDALTTKDLKEMLEEDI